MKHTKWSLIAVWFTAFVICIVIFSINIKKEDDNKKKMEYYGPVHLIFIMKIADAIYKTYFSVMLFRCIIKYFKAV